MSGSKLRKGLEGNSPAYENSRLDAAVEVILPLILLFAPAAFGAVQPWSEFVALTLIAALTVCVALRGVLRSGRSLVATWAYVPLACFFCLSLFQIVELPAGMLRFFSPATLNLKRSLLAPYGIMGSSAAISFYPWATRHDLGLILGPSALFFVVVNVYRREAQITRLLTAIVVIGGGFALLALGQDLTNADRIYWVGPAGKGGRANAGSFIHYGHYGQYMNLCIGAALGLALVKVPQLLDRKSEADQSSRSHRRHREGGRVGWSVATLLAVAVIGAVTIFLSGSRSAMVSFMAAFAFATIALSRIKGILGRGWLAVPGIVAVSGAVFLFAGDFAAAKLGSLDSATAYAQRVQILKDLTRVPRQFPLFGTGLGTFQYVYPMYDHSNGNSGALATHAENEYAQVITETGFIGLALVLWFVCIIARNFFVASRSAEPSIRLASVGLGFGLVAVLIHSVSDFAQHIPANAYLTAVSCGLLVSLARFSRREATQLVSSVKLQWTLRAAAISLPILLAGWCVPHAWAVWSAARDWTVVSSVQKRIAANQGVATNADCAELLKAAMRAVDHAPGDVFYSLSLNQFRWQTLSRVHDAKGKIVMTPAMLEFTRQIVIELHSVCRLCSTYGPTYRLAAHLDIDILHDPVGITDLRSAFLVDNCDLAGSFALARLDLRDGNREAAMGKLNRYLELGGSYSQCAELLITVALPDSALQLAQQDRVRLSELAGILDRHGGFAAMANKARQDADQLLKDQADRPDASQEILVQIAEQSVIRNESKAAVGYYRRLVAINYSRVDWHLALAHCLKDVGDLGEALREARIATRIAPESSAAKQLLGQLSLLPGAKLD